MFKRLLHLQVDGWMDACKLHKKLKYSAARLMIV